MSLWDDEHRKRIFMKWIDLHYSGCWLWNGLVYSNGTPRDKKNKAPAYNHSYTLWNGPVPGGHEAYPVCQVDLCVNPDHMMTRPVTDPPEPEPEPRKPKAVGITVSRGFTDEEVRQIRDDPGTLNAIARRWRLTAASVHNIKTRKTYKDVT